MPGLFSNRQDEGVDFELFSNTVLKFTSVLMVVLVLLAINVGQKLDQIISTNRFSGGAARPQLYLGVYETNNKIENGSESAISVVLESPSFARTPTRVTEAGTFAINDSNTFSGRFDGSIYRALTMLSGIAPGSMAVDGKSTPFVVPNYSNKYFQYQDKDNRTTRVPVSSQLALSFLRLWSDIYENTVYPLRAFSEFKNSRTRIYVETGEVNGRHTVFFGHNTFYKSAVKSGTFDFLNGLSSTNTEVIYLGHSELDNANQTSSRIVFFEKHGFLDAAKGLRSSLFLGIAERELARSHYEKHPTWELCLRIAKIRI